MLYSQTLTPNFRDLQLAWFLYYFNIYFIILPIRNFNCIFHENKDRSRVLNMLCGQFKIYRRYSRTWTITVSR